MKNEVQYLCILPVLYPTAELGLSCIALSQSLIAVTGLFSFNRTLQHTHTHEEVWTKIELNLDQYLSMSVAQVIKRQLFFSFGSRVHFPAWKNVVPHPSKIMCWKRSSDDSALSRLTLRVIYLSLLVIEANRRQSIESNPVWGKLNSWNSP